MRFNIMNENNEVVNCDIIGMFEYENKKFIAYTDNEDYELEKEVYASLYETDVNNNIILKPITDDEDWDLVDNFLGEI